MKIEDNFKTIKPTIRLSFQDDTKLTRSEVRKFLKLFPKILSEIFNSYICEINEDGSTFVYKGELVKYALHNGIFVMTTEASKILNIKYPMIHQYLVNAGLQRFKITDYNSHYTFYLRNEIHAYKKHLINHKKDKLSNKNSYSQPLTDKNAQYWSSAIVAEIFQISPKILYIHEKKGLPSYQTSDSTRATVRNYFKVNEVLDYAKKNCININYDSLRKYSQVNIYNEITNSLNNNVCERKKDFTSWKHQFYSYCQDKNIKFNIINQKLQTQNYDIITLYQLHKDDPVQLKCIEDYIYQFIDDNQNNVDCQLVKKKANKLPIIWTSHIKHYCSSLSNQNSFYISYLDYCELYEPFLNQLKTKFPFYFYFNHKKNSLLYLYDFAYQTGNKDLKDMIDGIVVRSFSSDNPSKYLNQLFQFENINRIFSMIHWPDNDDKNYYQFTKEDIVPNGLSRNIFYNHLDYFETDIDFDNIYNSYDVEYIPDIYEENFYFNTNENNDTNEYDDLEEEFLFENFFDLDECE